MRQQGQQQMRQQGQQQMRQHEQQQMRQQEQQQMRQQGQQQMRQLLQQQERQQMRQQEQSQQQELQQQGKRQEKQNDLQKELWQFQHRQKNRGITSDHVADTHGLFLGSSVIRDLPRSLFRYQYHIKTLLPGFIQNAVDYIKTVSNMTFTHVVLQLGSTDLLFASPEDVMSSYRKLIDIIQSLWPDAHIFVSGVFQRYMTKAKSFVLKKRSFNSMLSFLCDELPNTVFVHQDLPRHLVGDDGIHPTEAGVFSLSQRIIASINTFKPNGLVRGSLPPESSELSDLPYYSDVVKSTLV